MWVQETVNKTIYFLIKSKIAALFQEDVIRRRLLIDGDGTGQDRKINILLKSYIKWINLTDPDDM